MKEESDIQTQGMGYLETLPRRLVTLYLPLGIFLFVLLFPFYWMVVTSFKPNEELISRSGNPFWIVAPTLDHFKKLLETAGPDERLGLEYLIALKMRERDKAREPMLRALDKTASSHYAQRIQRYLQEQADAYSVGLGLIYVNLAGREPKGIVPESEAPALLEEIKQKLLAAKDPETGGLFCKEAYLVSEIHSGPHLGIEADLIPGFAAMYRVGWSTSAGGLSMKKGEDGTYSVAPYCTNNDSFWSGDHVSMALSEVQGVFFSNRKVAIPAEGVRSMQIAPTVLSLLGVAVPAEMDLEPLRVD